eukprot:scaffold95452_cov40-Prasinocladus_malaysianus.AAC.3
MGERGSGRRGHRSGGQEIRAQSISAGSQGALPLKSDCAPETPACLSSLAEIGQLESQLLFL